LTDTDILNISYHGHGYFILCVSLYGHGHGLRTFTTLHIETPSFRIPIVRVRFGPPPPGWRTSTLTAGPTRTNSRVANSGVGNSDSRAVKQYLIKYIGRRTSFEAGDFAQPVAVRALYEVSTNSSFAHCFLLVFPRVLWWWTHSDGLDGGSATCYHKGWSIQGIKTAELESTTTNIRSIYLWWSCSKGGIRVMG
jgi:hypothetical protein